MSKHMVLMCYDSEMTNGDSCRSNRANKLRGKNDPLPSLIITSDKTPYVPKFATIKGGGCLNRLKRKAVL